MRFNFLILLLAPSLMAQPIPPSIARPVRGMTISLMGSNTTTASAASLATSASWMPKPGAMYFCFAGNGKASAPDIPTCAGNDLVWQQIQTTNYFSLATPTLRATVFYARCTSGGTLGTTTATYGANQLSQTILVIEVTGSNNDGAAGTNALGEIVHNGGNVNTNATATFSAFPGTRDLEIGFVGYNLNTTVLAAESGWTKIANISINNPSLAGAVVYKLLADDTSFLATNAAAMSWATIGTRIRQLGQFP